MPEFHPSPRPVSSPWGEIDHAEQIAPGIWSVSTPSHGGLQVSPERLKAMPGYFIEAGFRGGALSRCGWFEEDCDWTLVVVAFPEAFSLDEFETARKIAQRWHEAAYRRFVVERATVAA